MITLRLNMYTTEELKILGKILAKAATDLEDATESLQHIKTDIESAHLFVLSHIVENATRDALHAVIAPSDI